MATPAPPPPPANRAGRRTSQSRLYSWEEYKLFYETTEKVIDRRIALNTWNYGICIAMLVASGLLANWAVAQSELRLTLIIGITFVMIMGVLLCWNWTRQVSDLKLLNNAKFEVLNNMAPSVRFPENLPSFEPFRKEWEILDKHEATAVKGNLGVKVLKSSGSEFLLPYAFAILFGIIIVVTALIVLSNWGTLMREPFNLPAKEGKSTAPTCSGNC